MDRVCIYGAGSIGGLIGARMALGGACRVSAVARGASLEALRRDGLRLYQDGQWHPAAVQAEADPAALGEQDLVVIAVKAPALSEIAPRVAPLLGPHTVVLPAMNGVPWWFGHGVAALGDAPLASVDPGGRIAAAIPMAAVLGCVVHASASLDAPGQVRHQRGLGLIIGEPAGGISPRVAHWAERLQHAGFEVQASPAVRRDIWYKLWGNMTMNPISALTGTTVDKVLDDPLLRGFCSAVMAEAAAVGERIGCAIDQTAEDRHQVTRRLGAFKTSMLQDVEAGRVVELDALVGAVREMAARLGLPTPWSDALYGMARVFAQARGLYPA